MGHKWCFSPLFPPRLPHVDWCLKSAGVSDSRRQDDDQPHAGLAEGQRASVVRRHRHYLNRISGGVGTISVLKFSSRACDPAHGSCVACAVSKRRPSDGVLAAALLLSNHFKTSASPSLWAQPGCRVTCATWSLCSSAAGWCLQFRWCARFTYQDAKADCHRLPGP